MRGITNDRGENSGHAIIAMIMYDFLIDTYANLWHLITNTTNGKSH